MREAEVVGQLGAPLVPKETDGEGDALLRYAGGAKLFFYCENDDRLSLILIEDAAALTVGGRPDGRVSESEALGCFAEVSVTFRETEYRREDGELALDRELSLKQIGVSIYGDGSGMLCGCAIHLVFDEFDQARWPSPAGSSCPVDGVG